MDSFLFCLILVAAIAMGGREQILVAQLSDSLADHSGSTIQRPAPLLALAIVCAALTASVMTYAGFTLGGIMPPRAAWMLVACARAIAAIELFWPVRVKPAKEPTRSLFAIAAVLIWRQVGDAARFIVFAFAVEASLPFTAFLGGAMGGGVAVAIGWALGAKKLEAWPLRWIRVGLGLCLIIAGLFIGLNARYGTT